MRIFRSSDAPVGPVDPATFLGRATVQRLAHDETRVPVGVYRVTFSDGARTNWHRHSGPQWLFVVEGRVRVQAEASVHQDLDTGDAVVIAPGERHWHGAVPGSHGTHIAVNVDAATTWLEPVSEAEYDAGDSKAIMASTTEEVVRRHVTCFSQGDLEGLVSDYSADAVLFTPDGPLKGHGPIREFFRALIKEFQQPGTTFSMQRESFDGDFAYALWSAETADNVYEMATDTHVVRDGKIVAQSFAGQIRPKR